MTSCDRHRRYISPEVGVLHEDHNVLRDAVKRDHVDADRIAEDPTLALTGRDLEIEAVPVGMQAGRLQAGNFQRGKPLDRLWHRPTPCLPMRALEIAGHLQMHRDAVSQQYQGLSTAPDTSRYHRI